MKKFKFTYKDTVRYSDCDMHSHMNHTRYLTFFEQARIEYFRAMGMNPGPTKESIPFIVVHASCDYRAPAYLNDEIEVQLGITKWGKTSFTMECVMIRGTDKALLAEAKTVLVMYDYQKETPVPLPEAFKNSCLPRKVGV